MVASVLIVEDEPEFLRRYSDAVAADPELCLAAAVSSGSAANALLDAQAPDVMLVDLGLPDMDGIEVIRHAAARRPQCDVLVVTMFDDSRHVLDSFEAGATGYLLKDAAQDRIASSIHELRAGGSPISPSIARQVLARYRLGAAPAAPAPHERHAAHAATPLSERETEVLRLVAKGFGFETVAQVLGVSQHTVVSHIKHIYRKLAVHSRGEAVYEARQMGLL